CKPNSSNPILRTAFIICLPIPLPRKAVLTNTLLIRDDLFFQLMLPSEICPAVSPVLLSTALKTNASDWPGIFVSCTYHCMLSIVKGKLNKDPDQLVSNSSVSIQSINC